MNMNKKREFTPFSHGVSFAEANPQEMGEDYCPEEIASFYYTRKSKSWGFFIEGLNRVKNRPKEMQKKIVQTA